MKISELFEFMKHPKKKKTKKERDLVDEKKKQSQIQKWRQGPVYKALSKPE